MKEYEQFIEQESGIVDTPASISRRDKGQEVMVIGECEEIVPAFKGIGYLTIKDINKSKDETNYIYIEINKDSNIYKAVEHGMVGALKGKVLAIRGTVKDIRLVQGHNKYLIIPTFPIRVFIEQ